MIYEKTTEDSTEDTIINIMKNEDVLKKSCSIRDLKKEVIRIDRIRASLLTDRAVAIDTMNDIVTNANIIAKNIPTKEIIESK